MMESAKPVARKVRAKMRAIEVGLKRRRHILVLEGSAEDIAALAHVGALARLLDVEFSIPISDEEAA